MRTSRQFYRVDRRQISMVRFVLEAYEGIGVATTLDAVSGLIVIAVAPGCENMVEHIMADLGRQFMVEACESA